MNKLVLLFLLVGSFVSGCGTKEMIYFERVRLPIEEAPIHVLGVIVKGKAIFVGTYGMGALFSPDGGRNWRCFRSQNSPDSTSLSWDFVIGGDWQENRFVVATIGDGVNISSDAGKTWARLGYNFFGVECLYTLGAKIERDGIYIATADGLVILKEKPNESQGRVPFDFTVIDERSGLGSQYIYDFQIDGDSILVGTLHGFSVSDNKGKTWSNYTPSVLTGDSTPVKVRAVAAYRDKWYAGTDIGLFVSSDYGRSWVDRTAGLPSKYVHDLLVDHKGNLWVATYKGLALSRDEGKTYVVYDTAAGFYSANINCLAIDSEGQIYVGTNWGLYRQTARRPAPNTYPEPQTTFATPEMPSHQWMIRPVSPRDNDQKDQTYLYGSTMGGNFRQHQGCEFNNPEGVPLLAVADGRIVYVDPEIGHSVLQCQRRLGEYFVYAHYHHQKDIFVAVGQQVKQGEIIGTVGKLGNVTNEHLHFEVSLSLVDDTDVPNKTVNNELWLKPLPGCGTIVGNVVDSSGRPLAFVKVFGVEKPVPTETPFSFAETYGDAVNPNPVYGENFVIGDVPAGTYLLCVNCRAGVSAVRAVVEEGMVTRVRIVVPEG